MISLAAIAQVSPGSGPPPGGLGRIPPPPHPAPATSGLSHIPATSRPGHTRARPHLAPAASHPGPSRADLWVLARVCPPRAPVAGRRELVCLLDRDRGPGALEGGLGLVRGLLVHVLEHRLPRAVDQVLGLLEAEARERPDLLDDLALLVAPRLENDVDLVLLLGLFVGAGAGAGRGRTGHRDRGRG